jgi:oligosaccharyl transferase (archaeosortase A-associated)
VIASRIRIPTAAWLFLFAGIALTLRIGISYQAVFGQGFVKFIENDAWYHMRLVDATVRHFPRRLWFDPYLVYPAGEPVNAGPLLDWVIAGVALVLGWGAPSQHFVDVVGAYTPAAMGALFPLPVYVLGRELFSRRAGLWAAFIVGILPGEILTRSLLGYTDHHCAETLLSTTALMWVTLAADEIRSRRRRLWLSVAGGVTLGSYLLTWGGGSLFVLIVVAALGMTLVLRRLRGEPAGDVLVVLSPTFVIAAIMIAPWIGVRPYFGYDVVALLGGLLVLFLLQAWGRVTASIRRGQVTYLAGLVVVAGLAPGVAGLASGGWSGLALEVRRFSPWRPPGYVVEAVPLLKSSSRYPIPLWNEFTSPLILAAIGGILYTFRRTRGSSLKKTLLLIWTAVIVGATFGQVRFAYYLAVNVALLAGFCCDEIARLAGRLGDRYRQPTGASLAANLALLLIVAVPIGSRINLVWGGKSPLPEDWYDALAWLQSHTPEPLGSSAAYYRTDFTPASPETGRHSSAYGVLACWEYGYWIERLAHRIPNTNPRQTQVREVGSFLLAEQPSEASAVLDALHTRYVIADATLQAVILDAVGEHSGFFSSIAISADRNPTDYCQVFELSDDGGQTASRLYCFPEYYQTMAVRLSVFEGRAVTPTAVTAISWSDENRAGRAVKRLLSQMTFTSSDEARQFIAARPSEKWRLASADLQASCVPLEALTDYRRVFRSLGRQWAADRPGPPAVQIFEYVRWAGGSSPVSPGAMH